MYVLGQYTRQELIDFLHSSDVSASAQVLKVLKLTCLGRPAWFLWCRYPAGTSTYDVIHVVYADDRGLRVCHLVNKVTSEQVLR